MDNLKKNMTPELFSSIDLILKHCPTAVFGGSIALNSVGLIDRPIGDIDLFFHLNESLNHNGFLSVPNDGILSETVTDENGKEIQRTSSKVGTINVCVFKVDSSYLQHSIHEIEGRKIKVQNVNYAINAKRTYAAKNINKHIADIKSIETVLDSII